MKGDNNVGAGVIPVRSSNLYWKTLDGLPRSLRRLLWEAVVDYDPIQTMQEYRRALKRGLSHSAACALIAASLARDQDTELHEFLGTKGVWGKSFGAYPHLAANATIQPYGRDA